MSFVNCIGFDQQVDNPLLFVALIMLPTKRPMHIVSTPVNGYLCQVSFRLGKLNEQIFNKHQYFIFVIENRHFDKKVKLGRSVYFISQCVICYISLCKVPTCGSF